MPRMTTAYAGSGDITPANVSATLNALLPDQLGKLFIPAGVIRPRVTPGLHKVVDWLKNDEMGVGEDALFPADNLVKELLARNEELMGKGEDPDDLVLVMVIDPASGLDNSLAKEAHEAGIRVVDLAQAGDDVVFPDDESFPEEPPADEAASEPAAEEPPFEPDEKPAAEEAAPPAAKPVNVAEQVESAKQAGIEAARAVREQSVAQGLTAQQVVEAAPVSATDLVFTLKITVPPEGVLTFARALADAMAASQPAQKFTMGTEGDIVPAAPAGKAEAARPITSAPSLSKDKDPQPEGTVVYYYDEAGAKYRPARGRKRDGEERVFLTPEEIAQAKEKGMIK